MNFAYSTNKEFDVLVGIEHRLVGEEAQETWDKVVESWLLKKSGSSCTRITKQDGVTGKCSSGGAMIAAGSHNSSVVEQNGGMIIEGEENQGGIGEMWVNCQGGLYVLCCLVLAH